jgi:uncharacterized protein (UPF0264 family)
VNQRPQLLVSVQNVGEAEAALAGGADWIDLKLPAAGPLGAVTAETARQVVKFVAGRRPVSAALGELVEWPFSLARGLLDVTGIEVVKLGLSGCADVPCWQDRWLAAEAEILAAGKSLVAVVYADWQQAWAPAPRAIMALAGQSACRYLLIDTFDKHAAGTLKYLGAAELSRILTAAHGQSLRTVVAGGIKCSDIFQLPKECLDIVAVRGGVCAQGRDGPVDQQLVSEFRQALVNGGKTRVFLRPLDARTPEIA